MDLFMSVAVLLGLAALFGLINERFLGLQATIGLMLLALAMTLALILLKHIGGLDYLGWEQTLLNRLDLEHTLLKGVLCFMLFAGSAGVRIEHLKDHKWTIATLAQFFFVLGLGLRSSSYDGTSRPPTQGSGFKG